MDTKNTPDPERSTTPTSTDVSQRRAWSIVAMIVVLMLINFGDKAILGLAAEPIMKDLNLSNAQFGAVASSFYLLFGLSAILVGFISARVPTTKVLFVIAVLWTVSIAPILIWATLPVLFLSRITLGFAEGPTSPIGVHAVHKWFPEGARSLPTALTQVGGALGVFIAGPVLTAIIFRFSWEAAFGVLAAASAIWALVWIFVGKEGPLSTYTAAWTGAADQAEPEPTIKYRRLMISRTWLGCLVTGIGSYWALAVGVAWLPKLLHTGFGFSHSTIGILVAIPPALSVVTMLAVPWIADRMIAKGQSGRMARAVVTGAGLVVCGIAGILVPLAQGNLALVFVFIMVGAPSFVYPMSYLMIAHISPVKPRGAIMGTLIGLITSTGLIAPIIAGRIMDASGTAYAGFNNVFLCSGLIMIVTGIIGAIAMHPESDARRFGLNKYRA